MFSNNFYFLNRIVATLLWKWICSFFLIFLQFIHDPMTRPNRQQVYKTQIISTPNQSNSIHINNWIISLLSVVTSTHFTYYRPTTILEALLTLPQSKLNVIMLFDYIFALSYESIEIYIWLHILLILFMLDIEKIIYIINSWLKEYITDKIETKPKPTFGIEFDYDNYMNPNGSILRNTWSVMNNVKVLQYLNRPLDVQT